MAVAKPERYWLGKVLIALGSGAFSLGAAYFVTGTVATGAVIWGPLMIAAVVMIEVTQLSVGGLSRRAISRLPFQLVWRERAPRVEVEKGFLDFEKAYLKATRAATKTLTAVSAEMTAQNPKIVAQAAKTQRFQRADVDKRLRVANETARLLDRHAGRFERLERTYREQCRTMTTNLVDMLSTTPATGDLGEFPKAIVGTRKQTTASKASMAGYQQAVVETRKMRVSQRVNQSCDRLIAVLDRFVQDTDSIVKACLEAEKVISKRWPKP